MKFMTVIISYNGWLALLGLLPRHRSIVCEYSLLALLMNWV